MVIHSPIRALAVVDEAGTSIEEFFRYLRSIPHVQLFIKLELPQDLSAYDMVITPNTAAYTAKPDHLTQFVHAGGGHIEGFDG